MYTTSKCYFGNVVTVQNQQDCATGFKICATASPAVCYALLQLAALSSNAFITSIKINNSVSTSSKTTKVNLKMFLLWI